MFKSVFAQKSRKFLHLWLVYFIILIFASNFLHEGVSRLPPWIPKLPLSPAKRVFSIRSLDLPTAVPQEPLFLLCEATLPFLRCLVRVASGYHIHQVQYRSDI